MDNGINQEVTKKFLKLIAPDGELTFQTFGDSDKSITPMILHGGIDDMFDQLAASNDHGSGIFMMINKGDLKGRRESNVVGVRAVFIDVDKNVAEVMGRVSEFELKPHCIVESSPGKKHVYWLVDDCGVDEFKALQKNLARHFGSDKAICSLAQVMRVPGFVHLKDGSDGFMSRIDLFDDKLSRYVVSDFDFISKVVDEVVVNGHDSFEVMAKVDASNKASIDDLSNALKLLDASALEYQDWLNVGMGIHSWSLSNNYKLEDGYRLWVGWSKTSNKHDDTQMGVKWRGFKRSKNNVNFGTIVMLRKQYPRVDMSGGEWYSGWIMMQDSFEFYNILTRATLTKESFNSLYKCEMGDYTSPLSKKLPLPSDIVLDQIKIPRVFQELYYPGAETIFMTPIGNAHVSVNTLNTWVGLNVEVPGVLSNADKAVVKLFNDHLEMIIEDEWERDIFRYFLAYTYTHPSDKIRWAILLHGAQGIGKTLLGHIMSCVLGKSNVKDISNSVIKSEFNSWADGHKLGIINEANFSGQRKYKALENLKSPISDSSIDITRKGKDSVNVPNFCNYLMFSNYSDSMPLNTGQRRVMVISSRLQDNDDLREWLGDKYDDYFRVLASTIENNPGALCKYFLDLVVPGGFLPQGQAPKTRATEDMQNDARSEGFTLIQDLIIQHECEVINQDFVDLTYLRSLFEMNNSTRHAQFPGKSELGKIMKELNYRKGDLSKIRLKSRKMHYFWEKKNMKNKILIGKIRVFHDGM